MAQGTQTVVGLASLTQAKPKAMLSRCCLMFATVTIIGQPKAKLHEVYGIMHSQAKALNHKSPVISSVNVAKLSIKHSWSNCGGNYCHMRYKYNMHEDVSARRAIAKNVLAACSRRACPTKRYLT